MATIADELENDFADSGSEDNASGDENGDNAQQISGSDAQDSDEEMGDGEAEVEDIGGASVVEAEEEREARLKRQRLESGGQKDTKSIRQFIKTLDPVLEKIAFYRSTAQEERPRTEGLVENDPEYQLVVKSNTISTSIVDYSAEVLKHLQDRYSKRFRELHQLLPDPIEYAQAVAVIGNGPMDHLQAVISSSDNMLGQPLSSVLSRPKVMSITLGASSSKGEVLTEAELEVVREDCKIMIHLDKARNTLIDYVESRMNVFAPNLTALIGSTTAARLLNARGGLTALSCTSSSNLPSIGTKRLAQSGFATNVGVRNQGFLYGCELVQSFRPEFRKQAQRMASGKVILAARIDLARDSPDGSKGEDMRDEIERRREKLIEPPPNKGHRALPVPDERPSQKRGGRRKRKRKEEIALTETRREQNRMKFGEKETEIDVGGQTVGLGMLDAKNNGRIRALQIDDRTRAKVSKKNAGWASSVGGAASSLRTFTPGLGNATSLGKGLRTSGVSTNMNGGVSTSLNFNAKQGVELIDPKVRAELERKAADEDRYFKSGTFTQVGGGSSKSGDGLFKKPALPMKKK